VGVDQRRFELWKRVLILCWVRCWIYAEGVVSPAQRNTARGRVCHYSGRCLAISTVSTLSTHPIHYSLSSLLSAAARLERARARNPKCLRPRLLSSRSLSAAETAFTSSLSVYPQQQHNYSFLCLISAMPSALPPPLRVAIVGGGPGGLGTAIALSALPNVSLSLFEQARELREIGAGINIGFNCWKVLELFGAADDVRGDLKERILHRFVSTSLL
jgi:hypothetical protein